MRGTARTDDVRRNEWRCGREGTHGEPTGQPTKALRCKLREQRARPPHEFAVAIPNRAVSGFCHTTFLQPFRSPDVSVVNPPIALPLTVGEMRANCKTFFYLWQFPDTFYVPYIRRHCIISVSSAESAKPFRTHRSRFPYDDEIICKIVHHREKKFAILLHGIYNVVKPVRSLDLSAYLGPKMLFFHSVLCLFFSFLCVYMFL